MSIARTCIIMFAVIIAVPDPNRFMGRSPFRKFAMTILRKAPPVKHIDFPFSFAALEKSAGIW